MDYLPLFVDLRDRPCLVVGGGAVAARKIERLCEVGAAVCVVAPRLASRTQALIAEHGLRHISRFYETSDAAGMALVVSATENRAVNAKVFSDCTAAGIPVNSVDMPALSNVIFPAIVDRAPVIIAVSTGGRSPTLARVVRTWIEARLPPQLGALADFIGARRERIKASLNSVSERQRFWERIINGPVAEQVLLGNPDRAERAFEETLKTANPGFVALIGAGPGDPELLTLKALRLLQSAEVVLYDNLVNRKILDYARRDAELIYVGKKWRAASTRQEDINSLLVTEASNGRAVVRLKGGDPYIFGRGGEEVEALRAAGIDCIVVPGITAASGASSYAGIPLTHRQVSQSIRFVTGHRASNQANLDWPELARPGQTLVIYMGLPALAEIAQNLIHHGRSPDTPAALISKATLPDQEVITGTLASLPALVSESAIGGPTTIIVGEVVAFRNPGDTPGG
ncbi:MAG: siroheme synthase CysG [Pseudomonadales bacterium]|nr:uroporphyrinogen-III C-methyltransferase [Pseudomonadales bacterium]